MPSPDGRPEPLRSAVRVLAVSDEVDETLARRGDRKGEFDLIVACGDLPFGYLRSLIEAFDAPLAFVPGNHDPELAGHRQSRGGLVLRAGLPVELPWPHGAANVDGRVVDVGGLRVAGLGGCVRYSDGPNQYTQRQQTGRARRLAARAGWRRRVDGRGVDLLLTHAPPRGVGDADDRPHQGFVGLHRLVASVDPLVLAHGHVHPFGRARPDRRMGRTIVCNVVGRRLLDIEPSVGLLGERGRRGA